LKINARNCSLAFSFWWHFGGTFVVAARGMNRSVPIAFHLSARHLCCNP